ncbi:hypothetical protein [Extensimonas perlucida]|uniref:hypothetical protein n=1 Tax=Extensimonas perlucida TaxID=2590786 RepID=UPI0011A643E1|nr:hypothetical protein [Extensimonas perlucida]
MHISSATLIRLYDFLMNSRCASGDPEQQQNSLLQSHFGVALFRRLRFVVAFVFALFGGG